MISKLKKNLKRIAKENIKIYNVLYKLRVFYWKYLYLKIGEVLNYKFERKKFYAAHGYKLDLNNPKSFNEKIVCKKIFDRNDLLPVVEDKYRVRKYLKSKLGNNKAEEVLVPLLYETKEPQKIPFVDLPNEFIIKANHGSGKNLIVENKNKFDKKIILNKCKRWLNTPQGLHKREWAYQPINRRIIIERLLKTKNGMIPEDYKFFIFNGACAFIQVDIDRHNKEEEHKRSLFWPDWEYIDGSLKYPQGPCIEQPSQLTEMISLAEKLGEDFDAIRVDLYLVNGKIYFGELTNYHGSGMEKFTPKKLDFEMGRKWKITNEYKKENWRAIN
ncbi:ATP-grasp fold amidoligase family protein [Halarsenatibacter silvermanii]|uniref:TupA-like ATPgrasp n=1 Tax=Halarsenatibacter silvermanii TaxID=321763 RepID=A0A1G9SAK4_9FIRM|nr:ATP-grasp fold amidoligase family protein [Halarsenatibacter silvermanii]SDM32504.1 TupA-like ATPgrasp [Halarsenatibacter silvermanii]